MKLQKQIFQVLETIWCIGVIIFLLWAYFSLKKDLNDTSAIYRAAMVDIPDSVSWEYDTLAVAIDGSERASVIVNPKYIIGRETCINNIWALADLLTLHYYDSICSHPLIDIYLGDKHFKTLEGKQKLDLYYTHGCFDAESQTITADSMSSLMILGLDNPSKWQQVFRPKMVTASAFNIFMLRIPRMKGTRKSKSRMVKSIRKRLSTYGVLASGSVIARSPGGHILSDCHIPYDNFDEFLSKFYSRDTIKLEDIINHPEDFRGKVFYNENYKCLKGYK